MNAKNTITLLSNRGVFVLKGSDAQRFLQGVITNDIAKLEHKNIIYTFMLSPQGKYLYDLFLISHSDEILIDYELSCKKDIVHLLKKYKLGFDVTLQPTKYKVYSVYKSHYDGLFFLDPRSNNMGYRLITMDGLTETNHGFTDYERARITNLVPDGVRDLISNRSFPFECDLDCAIDSHKGCYVGQEVVARITSRGSRKKKLFLVESEYTLPPIGTQILEKIRNVIIGEMRSSVGNIGLALLSIKEAKLVVENQADVYADEAKIKIHSL